MTYTCVIGDKYQPQQQIAAEELDSMVTKAIDCLKQAVDTSSGVVEAVRLGAADEYVQDHQTDRYADFNLCSDNWKLGGECQLYSVATLAADKLETTKWDQLKGKYVQSLMTKAERANYLTYMTDRSDLVHLNKLLNRSVEFKQKLARGKIKAGDWAVIVSPTDANLLINITLPDTVVCDCCKDVIKATNLASHQKTRRCRDTGLSRSLEAQGYEPMPTGHALHQPGIQEKIDGVVLVPIKYQVYAPKWMIDMADVYKKDGGFGNLTLAEYLNKCNPDNVKAKIVTRKEQSEDVKRTNK